MMNIGLSDKEIAAVKNVFSKYEHIEKAVIFGSRAKGNYSENSDIDIALFGKINLFDCGEIGLNLEELPLPYKFDVVAYDDVKNTELKEHIDRVGLVIYCK